MCKKRIWVFFLITVLGLTFSNKSIASEINLLFESKNEISLAGGEVNGNIEIVPGHEGKAISFSKNAFATLPVYEIFDPKQGTIDFWLRPTWRGDSDENYALIEMKKDATILRLLKTGSNLRLSFVYRGEKTARFNVNISIKEWQPNEWHRITASWQLLDDGILRLIIRADDRQSFKIGAVPFISPPETMFIGARSNGSQPSMSAFDELTLTNKALLPATYQAGAKGLIKATIDASKPLGPLRKIHNFTTLWNSSSVPIPFEKDSLYFRRLADADFELIRLVAFSDKWLWGIKVRRDKTGKIKTDFSDFDRLIDIVQSAGAKPYLRLAYNMPKALSSFQSENPKQRLKVAYAPPLNFAEWDALMRKIVTHCNVERKMGINYFVASLNEADLAASRGDASWPAICDLYERTVRVVREVDPSAKVGGPAIAYDPRDSGEGYMRDFLKSCARKKLPLDFVCFHGYRKGHPREYGEMIDAVKKMVAEEYPGLRPEPEYILDEFNLHLKNKRQDNEYAAAYITAAQHFMRRSGIAKVGLVSFNHFKKHAGKYRAGETGHKPKFKYNDKIIAQLGLPMLKGPVVTTPYFTLLLHNMLKKNDLAVIMNGDGGISPDESAGIIASVDDSGIALLFWVFDLGSDASREFKVDIHGLPFNNNYRLDAYLIDRTHTNPYTDYVVQGKENNNGIYNLENGKLEMIKSETRSMEANGSLTLPIKLRNMSVSLIRLAPY